LLYTLVGVQYFTAYISTWSLLAPADTSSSLFLFLRGKKRKLFRIVLSFKRPDVVGLSCRLIDETDLAAVHSSMSLCKKLKAGDAVSFLTVFGLFL